MTLPVNQLTGDLRTAHYKAQGVRFLRLFITAMLTQAAALDFAHLGRSAIIAASVGALEVAWREFKPALPLATDGVKVVVDPSGILPVPTPATNDVPPGVQVIGAVLAKPPLPPTVVATPTIPTDQP